MKQRLILSDLVVKLKFQSYKFIGKRAILQFSLNLPLLGLKIRNWSSARKVVPLVII